MEGRKQRSCSPYPVDIHLRVCLWDSDPAAQSWASTWFVHGFWGWLQTSMEELLLPCMASAMTGVVKNK